MGQRYELNVWFSGDVQGVAFRHSTTQVANHYDVYGYGENLDDGRVHMLAQGQEREVQSFVADLEAHLTGFIDSKKLAETSPNSNYTAFKILDEDG